MVRLTIGTKRALDRIARGETPYAAAKAEGIALATIYNAQKRIRAAGGDPSAGAPKGAGRGAKEGLASTTANFGVNHEDMTLIDQAAKKIGKSRAAYMRDACIEAAKKTLAE